VTAKIGQSTGQSKPYPGCVCANSVKAENHYLLMCNEYGDTVFFQNFFFNLFLGLWYISFWVVTVCATIFVRVVLLS